MSGPPGGPFEASTPACALDRGQAVDSPRLSVDDVWASGNSWGKPRRQPHGKPRVSRTFAHTRLCITERRVPVELGNYFVDLCIFLVGDDLDRHQRVDLFVEMDLDREGTESPKRFVEAHLTRVDVLLELVLHRSRDVVLGDRPEEPALFAGPRRDVDGTRTEQRNLRHGLILGLADGSLLALAASALPA